MSNSSSALITFRIWLSRLFGFQTYKFSNTFSRSDNVGRFYSLCLVVLIVVEEGFSTYFKRPINKTNYRVTDLALILQSVTTATSAVLAILSDSFFCAGEKIKQHQNFQQTHTNLFDEILTQSTLLENTNTFFTVLIIIKGFHIVAALLTLEWNMFTIFTVSRTVILTLMILQILTDIYTCKFHVECINNSLSTYDQQLSATNGIDFQVTTFSLTSRNRGEEENIQKGRNNSDIQKHIKIYILIIENLKLISKRYTYPVGINKRTLYQKSQTSNNYWTSWHNRILTVFNI